jgi:hypothetical protein
MLIAELTVYCIVSMLCLFASCSSTSEHPSRPIMLQKEYRTEGFINDHIYRVIIVRPSGREYAMDRIKKQAQRRAFTSLQKYLSSQGKRLSEKSKPYVLNLISGQGVITQYSDSEHSCYVFTFDIKKHRLKSYINNLGR